MTGGVYLAYPIDQRGPASLASVFELIETVKTWVVNLDYCNWVFDPGDAFRVSRHAKMDDSLPTINRAALNNSEMVIAFLPAGVASIGVPMEIDRARAQGKHVLVVYETDTWMLQFRSGVDKIRVQGSWLSDETMQAIMEWVIKHQEPVVYESRYQELRVNVEHPDYMPKRFHDDDAGLDLTVSEGVTIPPGRFMDVPCGVAGVMLPDTAWAMVTGRSSALRKKGLLVHTGIIDTGYRGPLYAGAFNITDDFVTVEKGERIAQLILFHNSTRRTYVIPSEQIAPSKRGREGFGSTGA